MPDTTTAADDAESLRKQRDKLVLALVRLMNCPALNMDGLETEDGEAYALACEALEMAGYYE
jgi:hypothetical protein